MYAVGGIKKEESPPLSLSLFLLWEGEGMV